MLKPERNLPGFAWLRAVVQWARLSWIRTALVELKQHAPYQDAFTSCALMLNPIVLWILKMIELFLNHWMSSSHSISHWINYVRILTCSSLMLQLLKTTCCLNSSLATLAWIPTNLWHHTHSIIKSLVVLCLLACLLFFLKGVLCWKMHTKVVQMLFVSEQGFESSYLWLQMFILMGYCAILAARTSLALYVCSQPCQHIAFGDFFFFFFQSNRSGNGHWGEEKM